MPLNYSLRFIMKIKLLISALLIFSSNVFSSDWESVYSSNSSASAVAESSRETVNNETVIYWQIPSSKLNNLCNDAKANAQETYDGILPTYQSIYPDSQWRLSFPGSCTIQNNLGKQDEIYTARATVDFSIDRTLADETPVEKTPEELCLAKPAIQNTFNNVSEGYINYDGCEYEATGVIVCRNDKTVCAATWKPTGSVPVSGEAVSQPVSDESDSGSEDPSDDNSGNESGDNAGSSGSGSGMSKSDMASAVETGVKSAAPSVASEIKNSLTEDDTSAEDQQSADVKTRANISKLESAINDGIRGVGKFADPDSPDVRYGEGKSEMDLATSLTEKQLGIDKSSHGAAWDSFLNDSVLRPNIPTGNGCMDFIMFSGSVYQIEIGCDKLGDIKSMLSWVMYCLTFWYVFTSITSLLRKGDE